MERVRVRHPLVDSGTGRPASEPGVIARITVDHADGTREVIATDGTWRVHAGPWMQGPLRNEEGDFVERIDARLDPTGWERGVRRQQMDCRSGDRGTSGAPFTHLIAAHTLSSTGCDQFRFGTPHRT
jgi:hypothetical protein